MSTESAFKPRKVECRRVELPSQYEAENWPIPEEPLSWEFLQQLHEPEECKRLIKERHGLKPEELFVKTPNPDNSTTKFDEYYLLKLALFRLERVGWKRISHFFDKEFEDFGETDITHVLVTSCSMYFTNKLKSKIKLNFNDIGFSIKRIAESDNCRNLVDKICGVTSLPINKIFLKPLRQANSNSRFDLQDLCEYFLQSITKSSKASLSEKETSLIKSMVSQSFSKEARAFLPKNVTKARNEARKKAIQQAVGGN